MCVIPTIFRYGAEGPPDPRAEWLAMPIKFLTSCLPKWRLYFLYTSQAAWLPICLFFLFSQEGARQPYPKLWAALRTVVRGSRSTVLCEQGEVSPAEVGRCPRSKVGKGWRMKICSMISPVGPWELEAQLRLLLSSVPRRFEDLWNCWVQ